jgi:uncharacterized membrane protein
VSRFAAAIDAAVERVARSRVADPVVDALQTSVESVPATVRGRLRGDWLGIPLHPILTDVTIGAWTGSFVADLVGGRDTRAFARDLILLGNVSALATIATGLADWSRLDREGRRVGLVHAASNLTATVLYARSYRARRRGLHGVGVAWGLAAATVATVGGHLGGMLVFRYSGGVDRTPEQLRGRPPAVPFASESLRIG